METSFQELKKKEAVNILDGKRLGKVCDVVFTYPEGRVQGIVVPGGRGFHWGRGDLFIELRQIKKIGIDVILVKLNCAPQSDKKKPKRDDCSPHRCPPDDCPPPNYPPNHPTPQPRSNYPAQNYDRRDYGDYE